MKKVQYLLVLFVLLFAFAITFTTSSDLNQDLSRHLKLGEIIWKQHAVPQTNLFSYTNPSFPFINHHWLAELSFYLLASYLGLNSLYIVKLFSTLAALAIALRYSIRRSNLPISILVTTFSIPLLLNRQFIRPELIGYLFFSLLLYIATQTKLKKNQLYAIPLVMLLWANIHITYIFGLFILFVYLCSLLYKREKNYLLYSIIAGSFLITFINPNGLQGALYPLFIFKNYGYAIVENQNLFYLSSMFRDLTISYYFVSSVFIIIAIFSLLIQKKYRATIFLATFFTLTYFQFRHMPFFVFTAIFFLPESFNFILEKIKYKEKILSYLTYFLLFFLPVLIIFFISNTYYRTFDLDRSFGAGFDESVKPAADYFKSNNLPGNIFNNFDIGGYIIYSLYPDQKVFIDNRPEAYPADFIQKIYIPLHSDINVRKKIFSKYNIHTVLVSHTDKTPWSQTFIQQMNTDNNWHLVYLNSTIVIYTDSKTFVDKKNDTSYLSQVIRNENEYIKLAMLSSYLYSLNKSELAEMALKKAQKINPSSCAIKRYQYSLYKDGPYFMDAEELKRNSWYCF